MTKRSDITGKRFNRWTVLHFQESRGARAYWACRCDCGTERSVSGGTLIDGRSTSCGCYHREATSSFHLTDLTGHRFGRLTVICRAENKGTATQWLCVCDCGTRRPFRATNLQKGHTQSCGCLHRERAGIAGRFSKKHGHHINGKPSPEYIVWTAMKARCTYSNHISFKYYGGRGIKVCARWLDNFSNFLADMGARPAGSSLDRINPDGDYEPGNCRWATSREQARNKQPKVTASTPLFCDFARAWVVWGPGFLAATQAQNTIN